MKEDAIDELFQRMAGCVSASSKTFLQAMRKERVNDSCFGVWNVIPGQRLTRFSLFVSGNPCADKI